MKHSHGEGCGMGCGLDVVVCGRDGVQGQSRLPAYACGLHFSNRPSCRVLGSDGHAGDSASMPQLPLAQTSCSRLPVDNRPIRKIAILRQLCRETALSLDACLVQVTGTRRRDSAGTSFARAALLDFWGLVLFSLRVLRLV